MTYRFKRMPDWLIRGKDGRVYLWQFPNLPLIGWFVFKIAAVTPVAESVKAGFAGLSAAFLAVWCYLEITQGSSPFRRMVGTAIAVVIIYNFFK